MEENKKLEAIMDVFKKLTFDEKKAKVVSLVEWLWESEVYSRTLTIIREFEPTEEYLENIYRWIMEVNLQTYEQWKEQEKLDAQQKIQSYMHKLNELSENYEKYYFLPWFYLYVYLIITITNAKSRNSRVWCK